MPRLLDLFCCEGGAGWGYHLAGWDVTGVDIRPQPRYPFPFVRADALAYLAKHGREFDAVHASPPCQLYSVTHYARPAAAPMLFDMADHPDLVGPTRDALLANDRPWIMENVPGAPMPDAVILCGTMFDLGAWTEARNSDTVGREFRELWRHRLFESSHHLTAPRKCRHGFHPTLSVFGHGGGARDRRRNDTSRRPGYLANAPEALAALDVPWMSRDGASQAIPPAYTRHLGAQLLAAVSADA